MNITQIQYTTTVDNISELKFIAFCFKLKYGAYYHITLSTNFL